jgi:uncharacterized protein (DUF1778 family)
MTDPNRLSEAELADRYDRTHDLAGFELDQPVPLAPARRRLDATISVRFSPEEIDLLRTEAERVGMKVTTFIRTLALQHASGDVLDRATLRQRLSRLTAELGDLERRLA